MAHLVKLWAAKPMRSLRLSRLGPVTMLLMALADPVPAVMPPHNEARAALRRIEEAEKSRAQAPDVLRLKITRLVITEEAFDRCPSLQKWDMEAQVVSISRGQLQVGAMVHLHHTWERYDCPGPVREPIPSLSADKETEAFLNCQANAICTPAAGAMSFMPSHEFENELDRRRRVVQSYR